MVRLAGVTSLMLLLMSWAGAAQLESAVSAWTLAGDTVYIGTENGAIFSYKVDKDALSLLYQIPPLKLVTGEIQPKVFHLDYRGGSLLWVREGKDGAREVELYHLGGGKPQDLVSAASKLPVVAAWFMPNGYLLALLDGEVVWLNDAGDTVASRQVTNSAVGAVANSDGLLAIGDEGGVVTLVNVKNREAIGSYPLQRDKILSLALGEKRLAAGGRDRRATVLDLTSGAILKLKASFFVMSLALSPAERYIAYTYDERGTIRIVDLEAHREILKKGGFVGATILSFYGENALILTDERGRLWTWRWR